MGGARTVWLVHKTPALHRLARTDRERLVACGAADPERLATAAERHQAALAAVRTALAGDEVRELRVEDLHPGARPDADLIVTVGGDGTVFTANTLVTEAPYLTVNSDPRTSVGHFSRATAEQVPAIVDAWRAGRGPVELLPRLAIACGGCTWRVLNDCLFTSVNPAAMTRYLIEADGRRELQRSSGVWLATAAGSTGAIHSAGASPAPPGAEALLWRVREPFHGQGLLTLLEGRQLPPRGLRLIPALPGIALYLDGPNLTVPLRAGEPVDIAASPTPLRLLRPG